MSSSKWLRSLENASLFFVCARMNSTSWITRIDQVSLYDHLAGFSCEVRFKFYSSRATTCRRRKHAQRHKRLAVGDDGVDGGTSRWSHGGVGESVEVLSDQRGAGVEEPSSTSCTHASMALAAEGAGHGRNLRVSFFSEDESVLQSKVRGWFLFFGSQFRRPQVKAFFGWANDITVHGCCRQ
jgi:hypothetical protein